MTTKAIVYRPTHQRQKLTFQGQLIGCTDTCLAMLVDSSTLGGCKVTELMVRNLSNERFPDPKSPGLNLDQLEDVAKKLHVPFTNVTGRTFSQLQDDVDQGRKAIVQLWYSGIGGTPIGHAVLVNERHRSPEGQMKMLVFDPIRRAPVWLLESAVAKAMRTFADKTGVPAPGLRYGISRVVPMVAKET